MGQHIKFRSRVEKAFYRMDREDKLREQDFTCKYCGCDLDYSTVTADHVIPLTETGRIHHRDNIVAACESCNVKKGSRKVYTYNVDSFTILVNEAAQRVKERGWLADYNIRKAFGLNVRGSFKKWVKYKIKIGDYK